MKPERLEMAGFAPFRSATEVDFSGLELFALTGPTGAGKSSVIDAITFVLYGVVARYDDRRSVEPVISLGAAEARIRFEFTVDGRRFTVARVVRRTGKGGATTAEARLESDGGVLASGASEVTRAVESLLGLSISHFTRSVVLPQGDFAAFLHDTPAGQQDLVKALLDLGVLDTVRALAAERARTAAALADSARSRLDHLADATVEVEAAAAAHLETLEGLTERVAAAEAAIAELGQTARAQTLEVTRLKGHAELAEKIRLPDGVTMLADSLAAARTAATAAKKELEAAAAAMEAVAEETDALPTRDRLESAADLAARLEAARGRHAAVDLAAFEALVAERTLAAAAAAEIRSEAAARLEDARTQHAAHALVLGLGAGDPCPVCHRPLEEDPGDPPADLGAAQQGLVAAEAGWTQVTGALQAAQGSLASGQAGQQAEALAIKGLQEQLAGLPIGDELQSLRASRAEADARLAACRQALKEAREAESAAGRRIGDLEAAEKSAWEGFHAARDEVAVLGPPPAELNDLGAAWDVLISWADVEAKRLHEVVIEATDEAEKAGAAVSAAEAEVGRTLTAADVTGTGSATARLAGAVATARAAHVKIMERRRERQGLESDLGGFEENAKVAQSLGAHLRANNFEGWLLAEALASLVDGANSLLADLSSGTYSLGVKDRMIEVVDHRNADERRSVRSLSGGETFLVSLALALSLGEQLINLSERGGARLDAIFLDEGFGTLDAETLDTVSAVVAELAAQGRVVGLVTHVRELAEQVPVRFVVSPGPGGSTIERVEA